MNIEQQVEYLKNSKFFLQNTDLCQAIQANQQLHNGVIITLHDASKNLEILQFLHDDQNLKYKILTDLFGVDYSHYSTKCDKRFSIIYNLLSVEYNTRIIIKVFIDDNEIVNSATSIYNSAGWFEREVFDMYGINFAGNNDIRRILTDYEFEGHPLRKDFPVYGYKEVTFDESSGKVVYQNVKLEQEYREFDFESIWKGSSYAENKCNDNI